MGVEYKHYLLPRPNGMFPSVAKLLQLVDGMAAGGWILTPASPSFATRENWKSHKAANETGARFRSAMNRDGKAMPMPFPSHPNG
jgi:hypothetical protein